MKLDSRNIFSCATLVVFALSLAFIGCGNEPEYPPDEDPLPEPAPGPQTKGGGGQVSQEDFQRLNAEAALNADLGQVYLKYGRFGEAIEKYQKAIEVTRGVSENAVYHLGLAEGLRGLKRFDEAVKNLEIAAEIFKKILPKAKEEQKDFLYEKICLIYRELGRRKEAVEWAEKIAGGGENPASVVKLARLYALLQENALAIDTYNMAIKKIGDEPGALGVKLEFADYLSRTKNLASAREIAEEVAAKAEDPKIKASAKRLLLRIYDGMGILDQVEMGAPSGGGEKKDGEEKKEDPGEKEGPGKEEEK
jgi:tetratricopeptide (TPR) repeat protein